jgi:POT family proton-dependent oligopeptide transporter
VLTAAELLVSVTALEFSYKQAPLRIKSFIMALFLLSTSLGNALVAALNFAIVKPVHATSVETGAETWVTLDEASEFVVGQKLDFTGKTGIMTANGDLAGTFLVAEIQGARVRLIDAERKPVVTTGALAEKATLSTYSLVGAAYYYFFVAVIWVAAMIFAVYASFYKERTFVRTEDGAAAT